MSNRLKMAESQLIMVLARLGWSYRRIAAELGVDRDTVSRHVRAGQDGPGGLPSPGSDAAGVMLGSAESPHAAIAIPGSDDPPGPPTCPLPAPHPGQRSRCEPFRRIILAKLESGLTAQRIWQDLRREHGFGDGYQSVQRFVKHLRAGSPVPFRRMECEPGAEAQVDFGRGAPVVGPDGNRTRPHLFRVVLSCSIRATHSPACTRAYSRRNCPASAPRSRSSSTS